MLKKQWARNHTKCNKCGKTDYPHKALGFCKNCYDSSKGNIWQKNYRQKNIESIRKQQREYAKMAYSLGIWERPNARLLNKIAERDGRKCRKCGTLKNLTLEHKIPRCVGGSNELDNLEILCRSCNSKAFHELTLIAIKFYFQNKMQQSDLYGDVERDTQV